MFGILRPCRHQLKGELYSEWIAHLCGLCLALRKHHGQLARMATNYDGLVISALVEAQSAVTAPRDAAGRCPLRQMQRASVSTGAGSQLAAAVSLMLASGKLRDHADDRDGMARHAPVARLAHAAAGRFATQGERSAAVLDFNTEPLTSAIARQTELERSLGPGDAILRATEPTEIATSAAFAHTAVLAGQPCHAEPLAEAGRLFGRVAHLLDAVEDLTEDAATGAWNPLAATETELPEVRQLCEDAVHGVRLALREVQWTNGNLVHVLLVHELQQAVHRTFAHASKEPPQPPDGTGGGCWVPKFRNPAEKRGAFLGCLTATYMCCSCQTCCRDPYPGPWSGKARDAWCDCDCDCCDCCSCCDC